MVVVKAISRSNLEWTRDRVGEVPRANRSYDPEQAPMTSQVEYTRAIRAAKLNRMFAKPFIAALGGHRDSIMSIASDPTRVETFVTGAADGGVAMWSALLRKPTMMVTPHRHAVDGVCVTPDGVASLTASRDRTVKLWDMAIEPYVEPLPVAEYVGTAPFVSIDHHQRKSQFATASVSLHVWDVNRTQPVQEFTWGKDSITCARYNPVETDLIALTMQDRGVCVYDSRTRAGHSKIILEVGCNSVSWNPMDPHSFVVGSDDWCCYLFDLRVDGRPKSVFQGHIHPVVSVDFSPRGDRFASGSHDFTVRVWDLSQTSKTDSSDMFHTKRMAKVQCVKWSTDAQYVLSGSEDAVLRVWKADASKPVRPLRGAELGTFNYMRNLTEKYGSAPEVRRILRQRNTPKVIRKTLRKKARIVQRENVKEMSRRKSDRVPTLAKRKVVQSLK